MSRHRQQFKEASSTTARATPPPDTRTGAARDRGAASASDRDGPRRLIRWRSRRAAWRHQEARRPRVSSATAPMLT
jgi:hypothetical protein